MVTNKRHFQTGDRVYVKPYAPMGMPEAYGTVLESYDPSTEMVIVKLDEAYKDQGDSNGLIETEESALKLITEGHVQ